MVAKKLLCCEVIANLHSSNYGVSGFANLGIVLRWKSTLRKVLERSGVSLCKETDLRSGLSSDSVSVPVF